MAADPNGYEGWLILDLFGHQRLGGYASEGKVAGLTLLRLDVPTPEGGTITRFFGTGSVNSASPCTEEVARAVAARFTDAAPVSVYELPQLRAGSSAARVRPVEDDYDADDGNDHGEDREYE